VAEARSRRPTNRRSSYCLAKLVRYACCEVSLRLIDQAFNNERVEGGSLV